MSNIKKARIRAAFQVCTITRSPCRLVTLSLMLILFVLFPIGVVLAHPKIVSTEPPADAQLREAPSSVQITFNETIEQNFAQLQVLNAQGQAVDLGDGGRAPEDPTILQASVAKLAPGLYTVVWQVVGSDGHLVKGFFVFSIIGEASTTPEALTPRPVPTSVLERPDSQIVTPIVELAAPITWMALLRGLMLGGTLLTVGGWGFIAWVVRPLHASNEYASPQRHSGTENPDSGPIELAVLRRLNGLLLASLLMLLLATPIFIALQAGTIAGQINAETFWLTLTGTRLGQAAAIRFGLALLLLALIRWHNSSRLHPALAILLCAAMLLTFAVSGHAAAENASIFPILSDWVHLVTGAIWVGGLAAFVLIIPVVRQYAPDQAADNLRTLFSRFSNLALACVAILAVSGTYAATLHLNAISDLWLSSYGQTLSFKLGLFVLMVGFGAYHRFGWAGSVGARYSASLRFEALIGLALVLIVGLLTSLPLPDTQAAVPLPTALPIVPTSIATPQPTRTPTPIEPFDQEQVVADLRVRLRIEPAALGRNDLAITVLDENGTPLDVQRVQADLQMQSMDMGEEQVIAEARGNGSYTIRKQWLSMVGEWQITILVRRSDADDVSVTFRVPVGG